MNKNFILMLLTSSICLAETDLQTDLQEIKQQTELLEENITEEFLNSPDLSDRAKKKVLKKMRKISKKAKETVKN